MSVINVTSPTLVDADGVASGRVAVADGDGTVTWTADHRRILVESFGIAPGNAGTFFLNTGNGVFYYDDGSSLLNITRPNIQAANEYGYNSETAITVSSSAATADWTNSHIQRITLSDSATLSFSAPTRRSFLQLRVIQDATGSRTITWPASVKWAGGTAPTLTTTANAIDLIRFYYDGTNYYGEVVGLDYS